MAEVLTSPLPAQAAAGATLNIPVARNSGVEGTDNYLTALYLLPSANLNGVVTNNVTFNFNVYRAGSLAFTAGTVTLASGTNLVAHTPFAVTISATQAQLSSIQQGDQFEIQMVQNGTGLAVVVNTVAAQIELG